MALYNPSIIEYKGGYLLAVRASNYVKYSKSKRMSDAALLWGHHSHLYFMIMDARFNVVSCERSDIDWDTSQEYEDPRITMHDNKIYISIVHVHKGHSRVKSFFPLLLQYDMDLRLQRRINYSKKEFKGILTQKNWCPFPAEKDYLFLHTDAYPVWRVRKVNVHSGEHTIVVEKDVTEFFDGREYPLLRCSTSWLSYPTLLKGGREVYICALHTKDHDIYRTLLVAIHKDTLLPISKSKKLCLCPRKHNKIQFTSGLLIKGDDAYITLGVGDYSFDIVRIPDFMTLMS